MDLNGKVAVITGGTDGIGAATARELARRGAQVWIIGRSQTKGERVVATAATERAGSSSIQFIQADFSLMANVIATVDELAQHLGHVDVLVHSVGILIAHKAHTTEGIELDFAVGYLSRFVMTRVLVERGLLGAGSVMLNIAASSPQIPRIARMEFDDLAVVEARTGMQSHGQAQMANDLFSLGAAQRWQFAVFGYGPGSVDTSIRRELPQWLVRLMKPFFAGSTRKPEDVATQLADLLQSQVPPAGTTWFFHKDGRFAPDPFVLDTRRQHALWAASEALARKALAASNAPMLATA
jgi:NAD(P)-dependent dehydrogenase (short-subunit alcohol dehydrogenase family)